MNPSETPVAVIGVGALGSQLAKRFASHGHSVTAYDLRAEALDVLPDVVQTADSAAEACRDADFVITCVTDAAAVEACVLGQGGVAEGVTAGSVIIDTTTSSPETTKLIASALARQDVEMIDAPVSRGVPAARNGTLAIWIGGEAATVERCRPLLEELGTDLLHLGPLGTGQVVKVVNMMLMAANLVATAEAVSVGRSWGLDLDRMLAVWNVSSGGSFMTASHFPRYVVTETYASSFTLGLMHKDVGIGLDVARSIGVPTPVAERARSLYDLAIANGLAEEDNMVMVPFIEGLLRSGRIGLGGGADD